MDSVSNGNLIPEVIFILRLFKATLKPLVNNANYLEYYIGMTFPIRAHFSGPPNSRNHRRKARGKAATISFVPRCRAI